VDDARVLHLDNDLHVVLDQLVLQDLDDPRLCRRVEVVRGAAGLLFNPGIDFTKLYISRFYKTLHISILQNSTYFGQKCLDKFTPQKQQT
jgi:hypothetical protein